MKRTRYSFAFTWVIAAAITLFVVPVTAQNALHLYGALDQKHGSSSDSPPVSYSACWGYVAPNLREYAIVGTYTGTQIIDITKQDSIREIAHISGPSSIWREMRTYRDRAYVVSEGGGGVQIINLRNLPVSANLIRAVTSAGGKNITRSHTIEIFDGIMYLNGCANVSPGGVLIYSLASPDTPVYVGQYQQEYAHDSYVKGNRLYAAAINSGGLNIADISDKASPVHITKINYTGAGTHNAWTTVDGKYVITTDEIGSTPKTLKFWDVETIPPAPASPVTTFTFSPSDIEHNVFVRGKYAYVAWYTAGIAVVNISAPRFPALAGSYDTYLGTSGSYDGVWAVYPYYWSGKVIAGDEQTGLYVFTFDSLRARTPVTLLEPADLAPVCGPGPIGFSWSRVADPAKDPHQYILSLRGPGIDTAITLATDTTYSYPDGGSLGLGTYTWTITTKDEANEIAAPDSFQFVKTTAGISLSSPNGGEDLKAEAEAKISWSQTCVDSVDIFYSTDNGATWLPAAGPVPGQPNSYLWTVPDSPTTEGRLRIRSSSDSTLVDESDAAFTIYQSSVLTVLAPNGGEYWPVGSAHTISWFHQVVTNLAIDFSTDGGTTWTILVADTDASIGSVDWIVPPASTRHARIRLRDLNNGPILDESDATFLIPLTTRHMDDSWSLASVSVLPSDPEVSLNFTGAASPAYIYSGGYAASSTVGAGMGFWIYYNSAQDEDVYGAEADPETVDVAQKWNILGSINAPVPVSSVVPIPDTMLLTGFYGYSSLDGYYPADTLMPGLGYWVRASENGRAVLASSPGNAPSPLPKRTFSSLSALRFEDASGQRRTLYFSGGESGPAEWASAETPPPPPTGTMDVRFASQRFVESFTGEARAIAIDVRGAVFPVTVTLTCGPGCGPGYRLTAAGAGGAPVSAALSPSRPARLQALQSGRITLDAAAPSALPEKFELYQNYPNPFNPETEFRYDLPAASRVTLVVFDVLGRSVATVVDELQEAGAGSERFDAAGLPSGVYYYRITAGGWSAARKMLIMR